VIDHPRLQISPLTFTLRTVRICSRTFIAMPYTPAHKASTRARILDSARRLFTRRGYERVTIDDVMVAAGLTRGGFYNHFHDKADLFSAAVDGYTRVTPWTEEGADAPELARWFVDFYLSEQMLEHAELQCPLFALPSDVSRAGGLPKAAYTRLIKRSVSIFRQALEPRADAAERAQSITALCVGAMLLANTTDDPGLRTSLRRSARETALAMLTD
jgi:AcrR family transcriptional regulator